MKIKTSLLIVSSVVCIILFALTYSALHIVVLGDVKQMEIENGLSILEGVERNMISQNAAFLRNSRDWSSWDDTYSFVLGEYPEFEAEQLTPLSAWMVKFARTWGSYLDTTESAQGVDSFRTRAAVDWDEYMPPPSGYLTFNQFFARHVKPGMRPIAGLDDHSVLVSPADSTFVGRWPINENSEISVEEEKLEIKGLKWSIHQLLEGSAYADRFKGGMFAHSYLGVSDYHRWHTPVQGKVLEARVIEGQVYMDVRAKPQLVDGKQVNVADIVDSTGFQFVQTRGLLVIDSPIGLVACLPVGMALVSSVVITAEVGKTLHKGEEMGYFAFGGSDFVMVFERASNVQLICQADVHYKQGAWIGNAYPYR